MQTIIRSPPLISGAFISIPAHLGEPEVALRRRLCLFYPESSFRQNAETSTPGAVRSPDRRLDDGNDSRKACSSHAHLRWLQVRGRILLRGSARRGGASPNEC